MPLMQHAIERGSLRVSDLDEPRPDASLRLPKKSGKLVLGNMVGDVGDLKRSSRHPHYYPWSRRRGSLAATIQLSERCQRLTCRRVPDLPSWALLPSLA